MGAGAAPTGRQQARDALKLAQARPITQVRATNAVKGRNNSFVTGAGGSTHAETVSPHSTPSERAGYVCVVPETDLRLVTSCGERRHARPRQGSQNCVVR